MIQVFLLEDRAHYGKRQLDTMKKEFARNFGAEEDAELRTAYKPAFPETRIYIKMLQGAIPEMLFRALGNDLCDSINRKFLNALTNPKSQETPSLVLHFRGDSTSLEFEVKSRDTKTLEAALGGIMGKMTEALTAEEASPRSSHAQTFRYEGGNWTEAE